VSTGSALCRGGDKAANGTALLWLDWPNYHGSGDQGLSVHAAFVWTGQLHGSRRR
jgi:hypothetical protein